VSLFPESKGDSSAVIFLAQMSWAVIHGMFKGNFCCGLVALLFMYKFLECIHVYLSNLHIWLLKDLVILQL
jgi:hypothetical protein